MRANIAASLLVSLTAGVLPAQGTRLLRDPSLSATQIAFTYGGDVWVVGRQGGDARRLTSTAAVEADPHLSPDGRLVAFTSNRAGGGTITAPALVVFGPNGEFIAEGEGVHPDLEVLQDSRLVMQGRDPQLERAVP